MTRRTERSLWGLTALSALLAVAGVRYGGAGVAAPAAAPPGVVPPLMAFDDERLSVAEGDVVEHDLFRLERRPASGAFTDPGAGGVPGPPGPPPPSPLQTVVLKGVVGGPPWRGILEGAPGRPGSVVVDVGDTLAGYRVRQVRSDAVVLAGPDSSVTLNLKRTWQ